MIDFGSNESFIANYEQLKSSRKMGELYGCDKKTITNHAKKIGYDYSGHKEIKIPISAEELYQLYQELGTCAAVAERFGCSSTAIRNKLKAAGYTLVNQQAKLKNVSDEEFILLYDQLKSAKKVGEHFGCSGTAVINHAKKIGYDVNSNKKYKLTEADKQYIRDHYTTLSSSELATQFQVSRGMITKIWYDAHQRGKPHLGTRNIDVTGQTFGLWTALYPTEERSKSGSVMWHCKCDCGVERNVSLNTLRNHTSLSCGAHANISRGNEKIKTILLEAGIPFEIEKKFPTCKDQKEMPFDFYVNESYLIEYDGVQHFKESIFDYEYTHKHDLMKSQWCFENNIPLIRIPYTRYKELILEDLLLETSHFIEDYADYKLGKIGEVLQNQQDNTEVNDSIARGESSPQSVESE